MHGLEFGMGMGGEVGTSCGLDGQDQSIDKPRYAKELLIPRNRIGQCDMHPAYRVSLKICCVAGKSINAVMNAKRTRAPSPKAF